MRGSSPLTRGKPDLSEVGGALRRLIPAHAGKTTPPPTQPETSPAHPRSRGENHDLPVDELHLAGSSPLTRGKHARDVGGAILQGLIPAHAGKTEVRGACSLPMTAHPRSRGENQPDVQPGRPSRGSSPLTRGKRIHDHHLHARPRLIPAHAGKTAYPLEASSSRSAHPRSRGENNTGVVDAARQSGSSPLTRGKRGREKAKADAERLIPAHAGKTCSTRRTSPPAAAHPRSRGENR